MKMKTKLSFALASMCLVNTVFAVPTIYPRSVTLITSVLNKTNSNIVGDTDDEKQFWVMPPNSGSSVVSGLHTITSNNGFCSEMRDLQTFSRETTARIAEITSKELASQEKIDAKAEELSNARKEMAEYTTTNNIKEVQYIDDHIASLESTIAGLNDKLNACGDNCALIAGQISELNNERRKEVARRRTLVSSQMKEVRIYESKKARVQYLTEELETMSESLSVLQEKLVKLHKTYNDMYSSFGRMEGARASMIFESKWDENVASLRQNNPGFSFQKIQTQDAIITTSIADLKSIPRDGAILSYEMGGSVSEGMIKFPSYPDNLSGNVRLSLLGSCPVLHPEYFDINLPNGSDKMKYGITVSYEYPSAFVASAKMTYNMHKIYEKIVKSGKKGGFFSSRSWSSAQEKTFFQDEFKVEWKEQDASNAISPEDKDEMEKEMRNRIFGRLAAIGLPSLPNPGQLLAPTLPTNGASFLGSSLANNKACSTNIYCMSAAIGIQTLAAIFGNSSTSASYKNTQDANMVEEWSKEKVIFKPWISSYR